MKLRNHSGKDIFDKKQNNKKGKSTINVYTVKDTDRSGKCINSDSSRSKP